jgi:hypothetical protein
MLWRVTFGRKPVREPGLKDYRFDVMTHLTMKDELLDAQALRADDHCGSGGAA